MTLSKSARNILISLSTLGRFRLRTASFVRNHDYSRKLSQNSNSYNRIYSFAIQR